MTRAKKTVQEIRKIQKELTVKTPVKSQFIIPRFRVAMQIVKEMQVLQRQAA